MKPYQKQQRRIYSFLVLVGLCFAAGVAVGVLRQGDAATAPESLSACFLERAKWVICAFGLGFFPFGLFFVLPLMICCGFFFGTAAGACFENPTGYVLLFFQYLPYLAALVTIGTASALLSFSRYLQPENKKAALPREQQRRYTEYSIFFLISLFFTFVSATLWYLFSS